MELTSRLNLSHNSKSSSVVLHLGDKSEHEFLHWCSASDVSRGNTAVTGLSDMIGGRVNLINKLRPLSVEPSKFMTEVTSMVRTSKRSTAM